MKRRWMLVVLAIVLVIGSFPEFVPVAQAEEKVLQVAIVQEPGNLDLSINTSAFDKLVIENWSEWLLDYDRSGKLVPGVASWKVSPGGKKLEFTLRKGVKFHSGDLLTSKDVLFGFERARKNSPSSRSTLKPVDRLEIIDDYHFNIHLKQPNVLLLCNRTNIPVVSKSYYDRVGEKTFTKQPSGTGPYKFVNYKPGQYVDIERYEEYWGEKPPIKKARLYFVSDGNTRVAKLRAGEVDFIQGVSYPLVKELENSSNLKMVKLELNHPKRSILFGAGKEMPWRDKRVRLAMAHAIDYKMIVDKICNGIPNHFPAIAPGDMGYDPELKDYDYDPEKAKKLLVEAGYPNGIDIDKFYWEFGGRVPMASQIVQAIVSYWGEVGIRAKLIAEESSACRRRRNIILKPDSDFILYYGAGYAGGIDGTQPLNTYFSADGSRPIFTHSEVTKLTREGLATFDDAKRVELVKKAMMILHEEVAVIPIITNNTVYAMQKNVDFHPRNCGQLDYMYIKDIAFK